MIVRQTGHDQSAKVDQLKPDPLNQQIRQFLHQRAHERATSLRWNTYIVIIAYVLLAAAIILTLNGVDMVLVGPLAVAGLAFVWIISRVQARKLEHRLLEEEMRAYSDLLRNATSTPPATTPAAAPNAGPAAENAAPVAPTEPSPLTDRECEVLSQMAAGRTNKETAHFLNISEQTVKNHIGHIFLKLNVNDRTSAVLLAIRKGWIEDQPPVAPHSD